MKKYVLHGLGALLIIIGLMVPVLASESTTMVRTQAMAQAYLDVIDNCIAQYGTTTETKQAYPDPRPEGLAYSNLADFTGDGVEELHLLYLTGEIYGTTGYSDSILTEEIWTWNGSQATCSLQKTYYSTESTYGHSGVKRYVTTDDNGQSYLTGTASSTYNGIDCRILNSAIMMYDTSGTIVDSLGYALVKPEPFDDQSLWSQFDYEITRNGNVVETGTYADLMTKDYAAYDEDPQDLYISLSETTAGITFYDFYNVEEMETLVNVGAYQSLSWVTASCRDVLEAAAVVDITGTYKGYYDATQGTTGLTLSVWDTTAMFEFYPFPGETNSETGSFAMGWSESNGTYDFNATAWLDEPDEYVMVDLDLEYENGQLIGQYSADTGWFSTTTGYVELTKIADKNVTLDDGLLYTSYHDTIANVTADSVLTSGRLPKGLGLYQNGDISGIPMETGVFVFTVTTSKGAVEYSLSIGQNNGDAVEADNDYTIIQRIPDVEDHETDHIFEMDAPFSAFKDVYLDGQKLLLDVEYTAQEGSTKIVILSTTFSTVPQGEHTINATFQTPSTTEPVTSVAQNFTITVEPTATAEIPYVDVATSAWYYDYVYLMYRRDIIAGTSGTTYSPESNLTRAMMVDALYQLAGAPEAAASNFSDVDYSLWYAEAVNWASQTGITNGTGDNQFSPDKSITREEMATMLQRYCDTFGVTLPLQTSAQPTDLSAISDWATTSATAMYQRGVLNGDTAGNFNPSGTATRAEAASMYSNFLSILDRI